MISDFLNLPFPLGLDLLMLMPTWAAYLLIGFLAMTLVSCAGFVLARLGIKPLWALLLLVPVLQVALWWVVAYRAWPREKLSGKPPESR